MWAVWRCVPWKCFSFECQYVNCYGCCKRLKTHVLSGKIFILYFITIILQGFMLSNTKWPFRTWFHSNKMHKFSIKKHNEFDFANIWKSIQCVWNIVSQLLSVNLMLRTNFMLWTGWFELFRHDFIWIKCMNFPKGATLDISYKNPQELRAPI